MKEFSILFIKGAHSSARQFSLSYKAVYACGILLIGAVISLSVLYYSQYIKIAQQQGQISEQEVVRVLLQKEIDSFAEQKARIIFLETYVNELKKLTHGSESALSNHMLQFKNSTAKLVALNNHICKIMAMKCSKEVMNPQNPYEMIAWMEVIGANYKILGDSVSQFNSKNLTNKEQGGLIKKLQIRIADTEQELANNLEFLSIKEKEMSSLDKKVKKVIGLSLNLPKHFLNKDFTLNNSTKGGRGGPSAKERPLNYEVYPEESHLQRYLDETTTYYGYVVDTVKDFSKSLEENTTLWQHTPTTRPLRRLSRTDRFGKRKDPFSHKLDFHSGVDFGAKRGTSIYAPADGVVQSAKWNGGYGKFIDIDHGFGFYKSKNKLKKVHIRSRYGHLSKILVKRGQKVKRGDRIGRVGSTGRSTGPHLHYEILVNKKAIDPYRQIINFESLRFR